MPIDVSQAGNFERLVGKILSANNFRVTHEVQIVPAIFQGAPLSADMEATLDGVVYVVDVKYYRTVSAQISLIQTAAARLRAEIDYLGAAGHRGMLVVACSVPEDLRQILQETYGLLIVDRGDLFVWAKKEPELIDELTILLEDPRGLADRSGGRPLKEMWSVTFSGSGKGSIDRQGTALCNELKAVKKGKSGWTAYEDVCERILKYLFPNDLRGWHKQLKAGALSRYDYVCRTIPIRDFWAFLSDQLNSRYVVFEFKNYTDKIKQGQILTTEKYLLERALRRTAIVFTREGADDNAIRMAEGAMREHGKLMLVLDDKLVCKMLHMKENGDDPSDLLFDVADQFLLALPR